MSKTNLRVRDEYSREIGFCILVSSLGSLVPEVYTVVFSNWCEVLSSWCLQVTVWC